MDAERYERLMSLFDELCDRPAADQQAMVRELEETDPEIAGRLVKLLEHDARGTELLAPGAGGAALAAAMQQPGLSGGHAASTSSGEGKTPSRAGQRVGPWTVGECLGSGGVGTVHRAQGEAEPAVVAIKFLSRDGLADPTSLRRFRREFKAIQRLDHPGCLKVFEQGDGPLGPYFVMEYVDGGDLRRLMGAPCATLLGVFTGVAAALSYVHQQGIVHRDLKPANVLLTAGDPPQPKLADFGIAKTGDATAALTGGGVMGSIDYLSPEQVRSKPVDARSDLYALGCTMYRLWTGKAPFEGDNFERLQARLQRPPPALDVHAPQAPPELVQLCGRLLQPSPEQRPASADEVASALGRMAQSAGVRCTGR